MLFVSRPIETFFLFQSKSTIHQAFIRHNDSANSQEETGECKLKQKAPFSRIQQAVPVESFPSQAPLQSIRKRIQALNQSSK
jgi:hypothetical protein